MHRADIREAIQVLVYGFLPFSMSHLVLCSEDTLVNIDTKHDDTAEDNTRSTEVVAVLGAEVASQGDPQEVGHGLGALDEAPGTGEVPCTHLLVHIELERVHPDTAHTPRQTPHSHGSPGQWPG